MPKKTHINTDFSAGNEDSNLQIDHHRWNELLAKYVHEEQGRVSLFDYKNVIPQDKKLLDNYLIDLQKVNPVNLARAEQMAFWINLYNALTVQVVLDVYPIDSIKKIESPFLKRGPWEKKYLQVMGENLSLDDIEHGILRPIYQDPRVHYAVNCASIGCPNLQAQAFTGENLDELLDQGAIEYINHPRGVSIVDGKLVVSSLYKWFAADFGDTEELFEHFFDYADEPISEQLEQINEISGYDYDWSINDRDNS